MHEGQHRHIRPLLRFTLESEILLIKLTKNDRLERVPPSTKAPPPAISPSTQSLAARSFDVSGRPRQPFVGLACVVWRAGL
ncbi:hypothetical protein GN956_G10752 [Arapaima gigas]